MRMEIRISKFETHPKTQIRMFQTGHAENSKSECRNPKHTRNVKFECSKWIMLTYVDRTSPSLPFEHLKLFRISILGLLNISGSWPLDAQERRLASVGGNVQKSSSSKAAALLTRGAYSQYVSTAKGRERRWRLFSTFPYSNFGFDNVAV